MHNQTGLCPLNHHLKPFQTTCDPIFEICSLLNNFMTTSRIAVTRYVEQELCYVRWLAYTRPNVLLLFVPSMVRRIIDIHKEPVSVAEYVSHIVSAHHVKLKIISTCWQQAKVNHLLLFLKFVPEDRTV